MKTISIALLLLLLQSCSHYAPLQMGSGQYTGKQVESCTHLIFGLPTNGKETRADITMKKNGLTSEDVFSIERKFWFYLWPLYSTHCTIISLNDSSQNLNKGQSIISEPVKEVHQEKEFDQLGSIKECNQFTRLRKGRCRKYFYNKRDKKKSKI